MSGPAILTGQDGEVVFVRRDLASTEAEARALAEKRGYVLREFNADEVEMLPMPEHFVDVDYEWAVVYPGTVGAVRFWRFLW